MAQDTGAQGRQVNAFDLASLYLRTAGFPDTKINRRILAAWFMAESKRVGKYDIIVYNNNPFNIRPDTANAPYHHLYRYNKDGTKTDLGKFASYSGTTAGAQAWADFVRRNKYNGVIWALKNQDAAALNFKRADGKSWGTSFNLYWSIYKGFASSSPNYSGTGTDLGDSSKYVAGQPIDAITASASGTDNTGSYTYILAQELEKYRADKNISKDSPVTLAQLQDFYTVWLPANDPGFFSKYPGIEKNLIILINWTKQNGDGWSTWKSLTDVPAQTDTNVPSTDPLAQIASFFDPSKWPARGIHILAILTGGIMVFVGMKIIISNAGVDGVSAGAGGATTIIKQRYPAIIDKDEIDEEPDEPEISIPKPPPARRAKERDFAAEAELERLSREAQEANSKANTARSSAQAPLKTETGAA